MKKIISLAVACIILVGICSPVSASAATSECACDQCSQAVHTHGEDEIVVPLRAQFCENCGIGMLRPHLIRVQESYSVCNHAMWNLHYVYHFHTDYICDYCDYNAYTEDGETKVWCTYYGIYI